MPLSRERVAQYHRERRANLRANQGLTAQTPPESANPDPQPSQETANRANPLAQTANPRANPIPTTRAELRARLTGLEMTYREAQQRQDWAVCRAVNEDREPLFVALWELERELPESEQYWFPARIRNAGAAFAVGKR